MIEVSIAHDKALNSLSDFAALLYLKILPHTDDWGRFEGDPELVRARVEPLKKRPIEKYDSAMKEIAGAGLWVWYRTDKGKMVVQYNQDAFERINAFLIKSRKNQEYPPHKEAYETICGCYEPITHRETKVESKEQKAESKKRVGDLVEMTDEEYRKLSEKLGERRAKACIEILDNYLGQSEKNLRKYTNHYRAILNWVVGELEKREATSKKPIVTLDKKVSQSIPRILATLLCDRHNKPYKDGEMCPDCQAEFDAHKGNGSAKEVAKAIDALAEKMSSVKRADDPNERFRCPNCHEVHVGGYRCQNT